MDFYAYEGADGFGDVAGHHAVHEADHWLSSLSFEDPGEGLHRMDVGSCSPQPCDAFGLAPSPPAVQCDPAECGAPPSRPVAITRPGVTGAAHGSYDSMESVATLLASSFGEDTHVGHYMPSELTLAPATHNVKARAASAKTVPHACGLPLHPAGPTARAEDGGRGASPSTPPRFWIGEQVHGGCAAAGALLPGTPARGALTAGAHDGLYRGFAASTGPASPSDTPLPAHDLPAEAGARFVSVAEPAVPLSAAPRHAHQPSCLGAPIPGARDEGLRHLAAPSPGSHESSLLGFTLDGLAGGAHDGAYPVHGSGRYGTYDLAGGPHDVTFSMDGSAHGGGYNSVREGGYMSTSVHDGGYMSASVHDGGHMSTSVHDGGYMPTSVHGGHAYGGSMSAHGGHAHGGSASIHGGPGRISAGVHGGSYGLVSRHASLPRSLPVILHGGVRGAFPEDVLPRQRHLPLHHRAASMGDTSPVSADEGPRTYQGDRWLAGSPDLAACEHATGPDDDFLLRCAAAPASRSFSAAGSGHSSSRSAPDEMRFDGATSGAAYGRDPRVRGEALYGYDAFAEGDTGDLYGSECSPAAVARSGASLTRRGAAPAGALGVRSPALKRGVALARAPSMSALSERPARTAARKGVAAAAAAAAASPPLEGSEGSARHGVGEGTPSSGSLGAGPASSPSPSLPSSPQASCDMSQRGGKKKHNPWSLAETSALVDGVRIVGAGKWAEVKRLPIPELVDLLASRSPVDLKDKWRNLTRVARLPRAALKIRLSKGGDVPLELILAVKELIDAKGRDE